MSISTLQVTSVDVNLVLKIKGHPMDEHHGGCLCGAVRYVATGPLREVIFCHCAQCRKQTGIYYAATAVDQANLDISGTQNLRWYAASTFAQRGFCGTCGSALFWKPVKAGHIAILAGSFDDPSVLRPGYHICTQNRAQFYDLADGLPQHPQSAPGLAIDV